MSGHKPNFEPMMPQLADTFVEDEHEIQLLSWPAEPKIDGVRAIIYIRPDGNYAFTRVKGVDGRLANKTRHIKWLAGLQGYMTIDCELVAGVNSRSTMSVLGSGWQRAIELQRETPLIPFAFDLLQLDGKNLMHLPWKQRRKLLEEHSPLSVVPLRPRGESNQEYFERMVAAGLEGIMLKDPGASYLCDMRPPRHWLKMKPWLYFVAVVTWVTAGTGKYKGMMGALELAMWDGERLVDVGRVGTGFTDKQRRERWKVRTVVKVRCFEITDDGKLWHPSFIEVVDCKPQDAVLGQLDASRG